MCRPSWPGAESILESFKDLSSSSIVIGESRSFLSKLFSLWASTSGWLILSPKKFSKDKEGTKVLSNLFLKDVAI